MIASKLSLPREATSFKKDGCWVLAFWYYSSLYLAILKLQLSILTHVFYISL